MKRLLYIVPELKDRKYKWGGNGEIKGDPFDCFGLLVEFCKLRKSIDILDVHSDKGYDFYNYHKFSEKVAMNMFVSYLSECFLPIVLSYKVPGDVLRCKYEDRDTVGIFLGNGEMLITSPKTNCIIIPTEYYEVRRAYRWPLLSQ